MPLFVVGTDPTSLDDEELARGLEAGDVAIQRVVWERYFGLVHALASRVLGPDQDADDCVQEVFFRLFRRRARLERRSSLRSFIVASALNAARNARRARKVREFLRLTPTGRLPDHPTDPDVLAREALRRYHRLLDALPSRSRDVFLLRHVQELPIADVAGALRLSPATVKRRLATAEREVTQALDRDPELRDLLEAVAGGER